MAPTPTELNLAVSPGKAESGQALLVPTIKETPPTPLFREPKPTFRTYLPQILATMAKSMLLFALGMLVCAPTVVIGALNKKEGPNFKESFSLTNSQASWFAGLVLIMQPTGSVLSGFGQEMLGRKKCMLFVNLPQLGGWLLIWKASEPLHLFLAALLMGFTVGFMEAPTLSYVGEIAQPHLRGFLASFTAVYISSGGLVMFLLASFTHWRTAALCCMVVPVLTFLAITQVPESPVWLMRKGREAEAERSLMWLRGWTKDPEDVAKEFMTMRDHALATKLSYVIEPAHEKGEKESREPTMMEKIRDLMRPGMLKPLVLTVMYFGFLHAAAFNGSRPYLYKLYTSLGVPVDPFIATVCSSVTQLVGSITCMVTVHRFGKRRLSLASALACSLITLSLSVYSYLHEAGRLEMPWLPLLLMAALTFATNAGIGVVPWILLSEVFPARGRGIGGGVSAATYYGWFFVVTITWLDLVSKVDLYGAFLFYSILGFAGFFFLYVCLPETEGRTLEEIEDIFKKKWFRR